VKKLRREKSRVETEVDRKIEDFAFKAQTPEELAEVIKLMKGRNEASTKAHSVKPDTWVLASTNILGLILVLNYEKLSVISGKAIGFVLRGGRA